MLSSSWRFNQVAVVAAWLSMGAGCAGLIGADFDRSPADGGSDARGMGGSWSDANESWDSIQTETGAGGVSGAGTGGGGQAGAGGSAVPQAQTVAVGIERPAAMAVIDGHVYWTTAGKPTVMRADLAGGFPEEVVSDPPCPYGLAADHQYVYWPNGSSALMRAPLTGGSAERISATTAMIVSNQIRVDGETIFGVSLGVGIWWMPSAGGSTTTLAAVEYGGYLAVDETDVYWTDLGTGNWSTISKVPRGGGQSTVLASLPRGEEIAESIGVDGDSVYVATTRGNVRKLPKTGGDGAVVDSGAGLAVVTADVTGAYWSRGAAGTICHVPASGGDPELIAADQNFPDLVVLDPAWVVWSNAGTGGLSVSIMRAAKPK